VNRRALAVVALVVQALVVLAVAADGPLAVRLPLSLLYVFAVPGFAVIGLLRLPEPVTEMALSVVVSMVLATATAQVLVWSGSYSLGAALAVLGTLTTLGLLLQLRLLSRPPSGEPTEGGYAETAPVAAAPPPRHPRPPRQAPLRPRNDWP
jgi:hypothetical protein